MVPLNLISSLDEGGWLTSRPAALHTGKNPGKNCLGGWVGTRAGLETWKTRKIFSSRRIRTQNRPARSRIVIPTTLASLII